MGGGGEGPGLIGEIGVDHHRSPSPSFSQSVNSWSEHAVERECNRRIRPDDQYQCGYRIDVLLDEETFWFFLSDKLYTKWQTRTRLTSKKQNEADATDIQLPLDKYLDPPLMTVRGLVTVAVGQRQFLLKAEALHQWTTVRAIKLDNFQDVDAAIKTWSGSSFYDVTRDLNWAAITAKLSDVMHDTSADGRELGLHVQDFSYVSRNHFLYWQNEELKLEFLLMYFISNSYDAMLDYLTLDDDGNVVTGHHISFSNSRTVTARARAFIIHKRGFSTTAEVYSRFNRDQKQQVLVQNNLQTWAEPNPAFEDRQYYCLNLPTSFDWVVRGRAIQIHSEEEEMRLLQATGEHFTSMHGHICLDAGRMNRYGHYEGVKVPAKLLALKPPTPPHPDKPHWTWSSAVTDRNPAYKDRFDMYYPFQRSTFEPTFFFLYDSFVNSVSMTSEMSLRHAISQLFGLDMNNSNSNTSELRPCTLHNFKMLIYPSYEWPLDKHRLSASSFHPLRRHAFLHPRRGSHVRGLALWVDTEAIAEVLKSYYPEEMQICKYKVEIRLDDDDDVTERNQMRFARVMLPHTKEGCLAERGGRKYLFSNQQIQLRKSMLNR